MSATLLEIRRRTGAFLCILSLFICFSSLANAGGQTATTSTGKYTYIFGDRLLTEKGMFEIVGNAGPDYVKALELLKSERRKSQHIMMGTGLSAGLALIAGAVLIGLGDGRSAAMIGSGIGLTASGTVTLGLGTYYSMEKRKQANRHLVEIINHFNDNHDTHILPSFGMNIPGMENPQIKEKFIRLSLQF